MATFNPNNFIRQINNPYFPLKPGTTFVYKTPDGSEIVRTTVTHETKKVLGVTCIVVLDRAFVDGELVERTRDYYAQDKNGNVWYFGEAARNFENGEFLNTDGSWLAGVNGATPGIIMKGHPHVGDRYDQENAPGIAEDRAKIVSLDSTKTVPHGGFQHVLVTAETNPLEPGFLERKYYAPGIGLVLAIDVLTGDREELVNIIRADRDNFNFRDLRHAAKAEDSSRAPEASRTPHHVQPKGDADQHRGDHGATWHNSYDAADALLSPATHGLGSHSAHAMFIDL
ncbi:MAG TPA: hypothetical protein VJK06_09325 [Methyloceanibacter sp.]|nr:hypothetical protein [Methyloceanibacter sp.]